VNELSRAGHTNCLKYKLSHFVRALLALKRTAMQERYTQIWHQIIAVKLGVFCSDMKEIDNILKKEQQAMDGGKSEHKLNEQKIAADRRRFARRLRGQ